MACARASLPSARYRTIIVSAEIRRAAVVAASPATATIVSADSRDPGATAVRQMKVRGRGSCAAPHLDVASRAALAHHHATVQEQQQFGGGTVGGMGCEQPAELVSLVTNLVT